MDSFPQKYPRYGAVGFSINNLCYFGTGIYYYSNTHNDFYVFDPSQPSGNQWSMLTFTDPFPGSKRYNSTAFVINNVAYVVTGIDNGVNINDFYKFDPSQPSGSKWKQLNYIVNVSPATFDDLYTTIARSGAVSFVLNGKGYLTTGITGTGTLNLHTWEYDPISDLWTEKTAFQKTGRTNAASFSFSVNNIYRGFVLTGESAFSYDDSYEFRPYDAYNPITNLEN